MHDIIAGNAGNRDETAKWGFIWRSSVALRELKMRGKAERRGSLRVGRRRLFLAWLHD